MGLFKSAPPALSPALRQLIRDTMGVLGEEFSKSHGTVTHRRLLAVRERMAALRGRSPRANFAALQKLYKEFSALDDQELASLAHGFSLMMEVTNTCENAYRSYRLATQSASFTPAAHSTRLIWVLTAHPTESRTPAALQVLHDLQKTLTDLLSRQRPADRLALRGYLRSLCEIGLSPTRKPLPQDEARTLFTASLRSENIDVLTRAGHTPKCRLRTWAGGDKDGHPGVGPRELRASLEISRGFILQHLAQIQRDLLPLFALHAPGLVPTYLRQARGLFKLASMRDGDYVRLLAYRAAWEGLLKRSRIPAEILAPHLERFHGTSAQFPAWVLPLELRESSDKIHEAWAQRSLKRPPAINQMLAALRNLGGQQGVPHYARALVVSMTHEAKDLLVAQRLARHHLRAHLLPVVPLFETVDALKAAPEILAAFTDGSTAARTALSKLGFSDVEIMLGYSDSSKECGVLYSRLLIKEAMARIEADCEKRNLRPLFFHGSGGSVARGGGNLSEITSGWSQRALENYKTTLQGEIVSRTFSSPEILAGQIHKLRQLQEGQPRAAPPVSAAIRKLAEGSRERYQELVGSPAFLELVQAATLYPHLHHLRIGSRPSKRRALTGVKDLRAIPWVMCWTQSRLLFPTWWGVGSTWDAMASSERRALRAAFKRQDPFLTAFMKQLGFTLAKVEMGVWRFQLQKLGGVDDGAWEAELEACHRAFRGITGHKETVWFRPWLKESVQLRSPLIHPLNVLQVMAIQRGNAPLLRQTVTGIASGMMTTG
jgi:phosphoenolpyruvate carboxylase